MGSCTYIGYFMGFNIRRYDEIKNGKNVMTYEAEEIGSGLNFYTSTLEMLFARIIKFSYENSITYRMDISSFIEEIKGAI